MMKKSLLLILFAVLAAIVPARALETVTVNDGTARENHVPVYGYYADNYQKSAYIVPAEDLTAVNGGTIVALTWYLQTAASTDFGIATFQIVLKEVEATTVTDFSDVDAATVVYEGQLDLTKNEVTINFATPFNYQGGNLLVGVRETVKDDYASATFYGVSTEENSSIYGYNSSSLDNVSANGVKFLPKTTFSYSPAGVVFIDKPKNLTVSDILTNSATVTWTAGGSETTWNFAYKKADDEQWTQAQVSTPSYSLDMLDNGTTYDVRVQAVVGEDVSDWTTQQFSTPLCDESDKVAVNYSFTDAYGDSWNGNQIQVVNTVTGIVEYTLTCPSNYKTPSTYDGTINLCVGTQYNFVWVKGNYPDEVIFTFSNEEGEIFSSPSGTATGYTTGQVIFSYTPERNLYPRPGGLTAGNVTYNSAVLSWTPGGEETAWQIVYAAGADFDPDGIDMIPVDVTGTPSTTLTGLDVETTYYAYVRGNYGDGNMSKWSEVCSFTTLEQFSKPTDLTIDDVKSTSVTASWNGTAPSYNVRYRVLNGLFESFESGDIPTGWTIVDADADGLNWEVVNPSTYFSASAGLSAFDGNYTVMSRSYNGSILTPDNWLISPKVDLGGTLNYWVCGDPSYPETYQIFVSTTNTDLESFEPLTDKLQSPTQSGWFNESFSLSAYAGQQGYIAFRNYDCENMDLILIDAVSILSATDTEWTVVENVTSPATITGLNPETTYELQVQAVYNEGSSLWTDSQTFTTPDLVAIPEIASMEPTDHNATITWTGAQETYNLRYRTSVKKVGFYDDFESGTLTGWTNLDEDGDGNKWYAVTMTNPVDGNGNPTTFDAYCATSASYNGSALTPDNWLISPQVELKGSLSVWLRNQDPNYAENFAIYLSTTGTAVEDFTTVLVAETAAPSVYTEFTADLSEYNGAKGYIAIRHFDTKDMFRLNVDNFHVKHGEDIPAGEWIVVENVTSPYTIEGLDPNTKYDVEIQGVVDAETLTEWTATKWFRTEKAPLTLAQALEGEAGDVTISSDLKVVEVTTDFASASDGEGNWILLFSDTPLTKGAVIANLKGEIGGLDLNPQMYVESFDESNAVVEVEIPTLDLRLIHREEITALKSGQMATFVGYYNADSHEVCAFSPDTQYGGLHLQSSTNYMIGSIVEGKQQKFTGLIQLAEAWDAPAGAPARVPIDDDNAFENVIVYITEATVPTGIADVKALDGKEIQGIYNVNGQRVTRPEGGVYIIRYTDGTAAKVRF